MANSDMMLARDPCDDRGLSAAARLIGGLNQFQHDDGVGRPGLARIGDEQTMRLGDGVHVGARSKVIWVLLAAMQHDDQAARIVAA